MPQTPPPQAPTPYLDAAAPDTCRNCQSALSGPFCHACGQQSREGETLRGRVTEALTSIATPGGPFFETMISLLTRPGQLTRAVNTGMRQQYVSPFATLLFAMLVLHGVQWIAGGPDQALSHEQAVTSALERADRALEGYAAGEATEQARSPAILRGEEMAARSALPEEERRERALSTRFFTDQARQAWNPVSKRPTGFSWEASFTAALRDLPGLFPVLGWLLLPMMLPVMVLLFRRREPAPGTVERSTVVLSTVDHVRFLAHALAFGALALATATALFIGGASWVMAAAALATVLAAHTTVHLRGAYGLGWSETVWRVAALLAASMAALLVLTAGVTLEGLLL